MKIITTVKEWKAERDLLQAKSLGFVPTMGALHEGHLSLVKRSLAENETTLVSIYLNPTQFNNQNDFVNYPRTLEADCEILEKAGVGYLFAPDYIDMYPDNYRYRLSETGNSGILCGAKRPGHFEGVLTVVLKLLNLISPEKAYFGEKDYQQYALIRDMAEALFLPTEILPCPIVREPSGLAMSSRNRRLSQAGREKASGIYHALSSGKSSAAITAELEAGGFVIDYVEEHFGRIFAAVYLEDVRLIDNVKR